MDINQVIKLAMQAQENNQIIHVLRSMMTARTLARLIPAEQRDAEMLITLEEIRAQLTKDGVTPDGTREITGLIKNNILEQIMICDWEQSDE